MSYLDMAQDVLHFCQQRSLSNISLLGHSMYVSFFSSFLFLLTTDSSARGGKVATTIALHPSLPSSLLNHLIIADITPAHGSISDDFNLYIEAMKEIEQTGV